MNQPDELMRFIGNTVQAWSNGCHILISD